MLTDDQLTRFAEHGWVVLEDVLDAEQCAAYRAALDRCARVRRPRTERRSTDTVHIDNPVLYDDLFVNWLKTPGILEANRQLIGAPLRLNTSYAHIRVPHPERHSQGRTLVAPDTWGWHRDWRPKWGLFPHDTDPRLIHCLMINNVTYLTTVSPGNGSTAVLDGSHRLEGTYADLKERCPVIEVPARAGSVLLFTESLIHAAVPIVSDTTRYNMYYCFTPPWVTFWNGCAIPPIVADSLADDELRAVLSPPIITDERGSLGNRVHRAS
jgi:ectoine hydroxylase-related dioxygenase (phytanoyl-CoA dioxygenase family)